jgi:uridine phosphorylase
VPKGDSETSALLPVLCVRPADLTPVAIVVGDPDRARAAASLLDDVRETASNREYLTLTGTRDGRRLTVVSHGVGAPGAAICFEELIRGGVVTLLRAGTCGAIREGIHDGDTVIATAAVREDGMCEQLIAPPYPAVADRRVTAALASAADDAGRPFDEGLVVTEAVFYPGAYPPRWRNYAPFGALAVEMEMSTLYVIAAMRGARAGGILTVDGNLVEERDADMSDYDPHRAVVADGVAAMLEVAVDAAATLAGESA